MLPRNRDLPSLIQTQFDDLQAEMEAGARHIEHIDAGVGELRERVTRKHLEQGQLLGTLTRRIRELQDSIRQQQETLLGIRRDVEARRTSTLRTR